MEAVQLDAFQDVESPERAALHGCEGFSDITTREASPRAPLSPAKNRRPSAEAGKDPEPDDRDWHWRENEEDIVLDEQRRIAVYRNPHRNIVLREENPEGESEDAFIVLRDDAAAKALIARLQQEVGAKR